jgi:hypothetical protein
MEHFTNDAPRPADPLGQLSPGQLALLLDLHDGAPAWSPADAAAALRHQLASPVVPTLPDAVSLDAQSLPPAVHSWSFADLLLVADPPRPLLEALKFFARRLQEEPSNPLHGTSWVLYYAAVAAARLKGYEVTRLTPEQQREGFTWARKQAGADVLIPLFDKALGMIS